MGESREQVVATSASTLQSGDAECAVGVAECRDVGCTASRFLGSLRPELESFSVSVEPATNLFAVKVADELKTNAAVVDDSFNFHASAVWGSKEGEKEGEKGATVAKAVVLFALICGSRMARLPTRNEVRRDCVKGTDCE